MVVTKKEEHINFLKNMSLVKKNSNHVDERKLQFAIQHCSNFLIRLINLIKSLSHIPVNRITFSYSNRKNKEGTNAKEKSKAKIVLCINNENYIQFEGNRAENLNKIFSNPYKSIEVEELISKQDNLSRKNDYIRQELDDANCKISKQWYPYEFRYGVCDLLESDGYYHKVNRDFAHYIQAK